MSHNLMIAKNVNTGRINYTSSGVVASYYDAPTNNLIITNGTPNGNISLIADNISILPKTKLTLGGGTQGGGIGGMGAILTAYGLDGAKWTPYAPKNTDDKTISLEKKCGLLEDRLMDLEKKLGVFEFEMIEEEKK